MSGQYVLLDGGMGKEVNARAMKRVAKKDYLDISWSAGSMVQFPGIVKDVHGEFLDAGAKVLTTNTYSCTPDMASYMGYSVMEMIGLGLTMCKQAIYERKKVLDHREITIAGSLPPLTDSFRPELVKRRGRLQQEYNDMLRYLAPHVDVVLCETLSTVEEARITTSISQLHHNTTWLSVPIRISRTKLKDEISMISGEDFAGGISWMVDCEAILINCCLPNYIDAAMPTLARICQKNNQLFGAYPNAGQIIPLFFTNDHVLEPVTMNNTHFCDFASRWRDIGATLIGGCCGITPGNITALNQNVSGQTILSKLRAERTHDYRDSEQNPLRRAIFPKL
jgi:S-methylmethionine-dependent homocysteine/selenocysteine methylase